MSSNSTSTSAGADDTPAAHNPYSYTPSEAVTIIMVALFLVSTVVHAGQAVRSKLWYLLPTVVFSGLLEVVGWAGRLWSHYDVMNMTAYQIQALCTVLGPTPLLAANFIIFGKIIEQLGTCYSRLTPKYYTIIFCSSDIISLFVQGAGGGLAAIASRNGTSISMGSNVMLGGIIFQLAVIVIFTACAVEYFTRFSKDRPLRPNVTPIEKKEEGRARMSPKLKIMLGGLSFNTLCLTIRAIYRVVELSEGWGGPIMKTELYFNVLEGCMIVLAIYTLNFIHPANFLKFQHIYHLAGPLTSL
ncbi:hypothetical protein EST38_g1927 [Candolleomyces aberdarensis]|uniref:RTA1-domain-containing protein n=1 Tax=Candolleomyces aberdarensis TaxID=2316362 RepID=A0A4Q2DVZ2_9AGAR|nr:hypothetical protein EST38_g1927 [Candolleomyces aberdarensis]